MKIKSLNPLIILASLVLAISCGREDKSDAYGNFENKEIIVSSEVNGRVILKKCEEGQLIDVNEPVYLIDETMASLERDKLRQNTVSVAANKNSILSEVDVLQEQRANLVLNKTRIVKMYKDGAATKQQMDDIDNQIKVVDKRVASINMKASQIDQELGVLNASIKIIDENIKKCMIYSPIKGTILETYVEQGELAVQGKPLFKISDISTLDLRAYVSGAQLSEVKVSQKVKVLIDNGVKTKKELEGIVTYISDKAEFTPKIIQTKEERVKLVYAIKVKVKNDGSIKVGMPGEVRFK